MTAATGEVLAKIAKRYRHFAHFEAHGVSLSYEAWALAVADDLPARRFLAALPREKQQPNLLFAAVRWLTPDVGDTSMFLEVLRSRGEEISRIMMSRRVQTNEPGRCATLVPLLARLPQPLALIEVGAAAGLCLLPDAYNYDYGRARLRSPSTRFGPTFPCEVDPDTPLPSNLPTVVWRAGLDLDPVDIHNDDAVSWLETLIWPEHEERRRRLRAAIRVAASAPPVVRRGDLLQDLDELVGQAPSDATVVVFHSAVLGYLPSRDAINAFTSHVQELPVRWVSNEAPIANPALAGADHLATTNGRFLLMLDGRPIAHTGPHGQSFELVGELPDEH